MNAVPIEIGMRRLEMARTPGIAADNRPDLRVVTCGLRIAGKSQCGAAEPRRLGGLAQFGDRQRIGERSGQRLVDKHWLARLEDGSGLLQMLPAIDALEQHNVYLVEHGRNGIDNLDPHPFHLLGEFRDSIATGRNLAPAGKCRHHSHSGKIVTRLWIIQHLREFDYMRCVQPDNPGPQDRRPGGIIGGRTTECAKSKKN